MGVTRQAVKMSAEELKTVSSEMAAMAARLHAIATKMEDNEIKSIEVTHRKTMHTGIKYCANFCSAADAGWIDAALGI
jgi:hypothetical protein